MCIHVFIYDLLFIILHLASKKQVTPVAEVGEEVNKEPLPSGIETCDPACFSQSKTIKTQVSFCVFLVSSPINIILHSL